MSQVRLHVASRSQRALSVHPTLDGLLDTRRDCKDALKHFALALFLLDFKAFFHKR